MSLNLKCKRCDNRLIGMTLIELLITLVIIGVLSALAYPSYSNYVQRSHRTTAITDISKIQLALEYQYQNGYDWDDIIIEGVCVICDSDPERYLFSISTTKVDQYIIRAIAQSMKGQDKDRCLLDDKTLTLTSTGETRPVQCWK